uniref:Uncharacterized protein n=1 Tax=Octactis speculum TaxID=3111310 RepID=A0A7S2GU60_9STRA|mmetsp:Transcript_56889/g.77575  ORF Transcript_56889/g.77575 Transcript_56889/m.77575 type:complete len:145 (+) Transcript_56889:914-1348(+)
MGQLGGAALAATLYDKMALTHLNLWSNKIGSVAISALADALHHNSTLKGIQLAFNKVGDDGTISLAKMLCCNTGLKTLQLAGNEIESAGATALGEAHNATLQELNLHSNNARDKGANTFADALAHNTTACSYKTTTFQTMVESP